MVDLECPDETRFPHWREAQPDVDDVLEPGEVMFIPSGWTHHVETLTDSISLTYNFVHASTWPGFHRFLCSDIPPAERALIDYFLHEVPGRRIMDRQG